MANFTDSPILDQLAFSKALRDANAWHHRQVRKDGRTPYMAHLMVASSLVLENGGTQAQAVAALLHDSVEDAGITLQNIRIHHGADVATIVQALTQDESLDDSPFERNEAYAAAVDRCPDAALVSAADKLHNLRGYADGKAEFKPRHQHLYGLMLNVYEKHLGQNHPMYIELVSLLQWMQHDFLSRI